MCNKEHARARAAAQDKTVATWPALRTPLSVEESAVQASPWHPPKGAAPQAEEALDVNKKKTRSSTRSRTGTQSIRVIHLQLGAEPREQVTVAKLRAIQSELF